MINFRYHIVSLTAVFLALAVGVVLGAGPLQNNIAAGLNSTLTQEVSDLRADKSRLNGELATSQRVRTATDEALGELLQGAVSARLSASQATLVALPTAEADVVAATSATLLAAGATVQRLDLSADWLADTTSERDTVFTQVAGTLGLPAESDRLRREYAVLGALAGTSTAALAPTREQRRAGLARLAELDLISGDIETYQSPTFVVTVVGMVPAAGTLSADAAAASWAQLASSLAHEGRGEILAGAVPEKVASVPGEPVSPVLTVRADSGQARVLSTVDNADTALGQLNIVLGLVADARGDIGHFGVATGAQATLAPVGGS